MFRSPRGTTPEAMEDRRLWGDAVAEAVARREAERKRRRGSWWKRWARLAWANRVQSVPVLVIAALLGTSMWIRSEQMSPWLVGSLGAAALAGYWWQRALGARSPVLAMLRPSLAVLYLVLAAVVPV